MRVGELLDPAVVVEAAVVAVHHALAVDEEAELGGLLQHRVEGPDDHGRGALRRFLERVRRLRILLPRGPVAVLQVLAQRVERVRPVVREHQPRGSGWPSAVTPNMSCSSRSAQAAAGTQG